jgi:hypothetical protein
VKIRHLSGFTWVGLSLIVTTAATADTVIRNAALQTGPDGFETTASLRPPAVSAVNGKVDYAGGNMNSAAGNNFGASLSLPVSHQFGFQADALYSRISDLNFYGGAGHLFWRDPKIGLLGLAGGYLHRDGTDNINTFQAGAEGELYYKCFTFGFFGGVGSIDYKYSAPFIDTNPTKFVGRLSADYYPLENLRVGAAFVTAFQNNLGRGEIEYQTPIPGVALTGEVAFGNHGYDDWTLGVRYYFGGRKTLRARQREDDPPSIMPQVLQSLGLYGAQYNQQASAYVSAHPDAGYSGGGDYGVSGSYGVSSINLNPIIINPQPTIPPLTDP